jgi:hypothetical protein
MTKHKIVLKKLKRDGEDETLWHPESRLVFKSKKEKLVVGRLNDEEDMAVDETVIDLCNKWKFKIDPSLVESGSEEEEEEEKPPPAREAVPQSPSLFDRNIDSLSPEKESEPSTVKRRSVLVEQVDKYCSDMESQLHDLQNEVADLNKKLAHEKDTREKADAKLAKIREHFS